MDANRKARYWHKLKDGRVQCDPCPHGCKIKEGSGLCQVRQNEQAVLYAVNYARVASWHWILSRKNLSTISIPGKIFYR